MKYSSIVFLVTILLAAPIVVTAQDDPVMEAKLQFSSMFMGTNNSFKTLKGEKYSEDDNWVYFGSEYGLGTKAVTILNSKKDTTAWYCYIKFSLETDLNQLANVQSGVFGVLNMVISGGKIKGTEETENKITRTDLYVTKNNEWLGELVTDGDKKTFHIFLKNLPWQE